MSTQEPSSAAAAGLTSLPRLETSRASADGFDEQKVREAFDAFRRHPLQLQAQLRVLQAAGRARRSTRPGTPSGWTRCI